MTTIKKDFVAIVELLEANKGKKVKEILEQVLELASAKTTRTFFKNEAGEVTVVYCYYHKKFEVVAKADYGQKAGTPSGLNSMCKEGVNQWTKQQRIAKLAREALLNEVASGTVQPSDLAFKLAEIDADKSIIVARQDNHGFDSLEEALANI